MLERLVCGARARAVQLPQSSSTPTYQLLAPTLSLLIVLQVDAGKGYVAFTDIGDTATAHAERMAAAATAAATSAGAGAVGQQVAAAAAEASASVSPGVSASQLGLPEGVIAASHLPAPEMWASLGFSRQQALDVLHVVSASGAFGWAIYRGLGSWRVGEGAGRCGLWVSTGAPDCLPHMTLCNQQSFAPCVPPMLACPQARSSRASPPCCAC